MNRVRPALAAATAGGAPEPLLCLEDGWWRTHGLPPQSGPVTADTPLSAIAATDGPAAGTTGATRCPSQGLGLQVIAARAGPEHRR